MKYWNKRLKDMIEYLPGEQPDDINSFIKLNTNENPFPTSTFVIEAIQKATTGNLRRYPDALANDLREAFAEKNNLNPENVFVANGSDEIFTLIFRGFINPDEVAAFPYPSYSLYDTIAEANSIAFEKIDLNDDFSFNLKAFNKKKYSLVIIANPNNPTGTYCTVEEIEGFLNTFKGLLVIDEAYIDFFGGSAIDLVKSYDNIIVTRTFSKSYSLAGLRVGLAVACADIIKGFLKIKDSYNVDSLAIAGGIAALKDEKSFKYNIQMLQNNMEYLEERLEDLGFFIAPSRANFFYITHPEISAIKIYEALKEKKILVRHFTGPRKENYLRISVGTMMEIKSLCKELESIIP
jgi:histidinol-phosphate aminotransferase